MKYSSFKKSNILAVVVLAAVLVVSCVLFLQTAHSTTLKLPENVSLILGVGTHGNLSSETTALMRSAAADGIQSYPSSSDRRRSSE